MPQPIEPPSRRIVTGLDRDERTEVVAVALRQVQTDVAAHRTAHHHRPLQAKLAAKRHHEVGVEFGGELVFLFPPALGRNRLAVARQIECDHVEALADLRIVELMAPFARIGARGMQADQRDAMAGFLVENPVFLALERNVNVVSGYRLYFCHLSAPPYSLTARIRSSAQANARRFCHITFTSPSILRRPCSVCDIAMMSLYIGGGTGGTNFAHGWQ